MLTIGILTAIGSGAGSFSVLIGSLARRLPPAQRGTAAGIITAGGSFGQFVFAPIAQKLISLWGWMGAMWSLAALTLACAAAGAADRRARRWAMAEWRRVEPTAVFGRACEMRFRDRSYLLLHGSFLTCGFHIAFLVTHLPGEVDLCGLPASVASWSLAIIGLANIAGSFTAGWLLGRFRGKDVLFWMYGSRTMLILTLSRRAEDGVDLLSFGRRSWLFLVGHGAADRGSRRQTLRHALSRHALRHDHAVAPDRRLLRRVAGWLGI